MLAHSNFNLSDRSLWTPFIDDVNNWKHFPCYWTFVQPSILIKPVNSPHKGQWRGCFLWSAPWINGWLSNREAGDLRRHRVHYDVNVMFKSIFVYLFQILHYLITSSSCGVSLEGMKAKLIKGVKHRLLFRYLSWRIDKASFTSDLGRVLLTWIN